ncbi:hypothetical protein GTA26_27345 [Rhodococcus hoagii]|nr:hypothetical protein [Prescottella equi]
MRSGLEGVPAGAALLAQWWRADVSPPTTWRCARFPNQREIAEVLAQTRTALDALAPGSDPFLQLERPLKQAKELAAQFSRLDSHLDQLTQHSPTNMLARCLARAVGAPEPVSGWTVSLTGCCIDA